MTTSLAEVSNLANLNARHATTLDTAATQLGIQPTVRTKAGYCVDARWWTATVGGFVIYVESTYELTGGRIETAIHLGGDFDAEDVFDAKRAGEYAQAFLNAQRMLEQVNGAIKAATK